MKDPTLLVLSQKLIQAASSWFLPARDRKKIHCCSSKKRSSIFVHPATIFDTTPRAATPPLHAYE
jgi:hypothetical protein